MTTVFPPPRLERQPHVLALGALDEIVKWLPTNFLVSSVPFRAQLNRENEVFYS